MMEFEHILISNIPWLTHKARQYYKNSYDADDLVSETIEKILLNKNKYDNHKQFRPWALTVMHNVFITHYNRRKCVSFVPIDDLYIGLSTLVDAESRLIRNQILSVIRECARKSVAIECVLLYAKGYSYDEISKILAIPKGTVMSRISNGRKMLYEALEQDM